MSARVTVTTEAVASPPPGTSTPSGQAFILGVTQKGPIETATQVTGLADYRAIFGERSGGTDTFDMVESAFKEGLASAYIVRLAGPSAAKATATLDTAFVVTATSEGAWGNSITAQWTNSSSTLTINGVDYAGASVATISSLLALNDAPVTVSGTLPDEDIAETNLSGGTDDNGNAVIADCLDFFSADLGDGAVAIAGQDSGDVGDDLATHCQATNRLGVLAAASGATLSEATTELAALTDPSLVLLWPEVTAGSKTYSPVGFALGARARAHATGNPVQSPINAAYGTARFMDGVVATTTDASWKTANAAGLSVVRPVAGQVRLFGWRSVAAPDDVLTLQSANYRDLIDRVAAGCQQIADNFVGTIIDGRGYALATFAGQLTGFLEGLRDNFAEGANDPGYLVDAGSGVNPTEAIANGQIAANVSIRCAGTAEFVTINVVATDAAGAL